MINEEILMYLFLWSTYNLHTYIFFSRFVERLFLYVKTQLALRGATYIHLVQNVVFIPRYIVKGVQDDISSKIFAYDCVTLYTVIIS